MGYGTFSSKDWSSYSARTSTKTADAIFTSKKLTKILDPRGVAFRESRDSAANPQATPVIVAVDNTGSMGRLIEHIVKHGLGTVFEEIISRKPVSDPHVMFMAVNDVHFADDGLQVSQFEAEVDPITKQLESFWIQGGGGGNDSESYHLPFYFAARHTVHDAWEKRKKKGYLFVVGDEEVPPPLTAEQIKRAIGDAVQADMTYEELLAMARQTYHVYQILVMEGSHASGHAKSMQENWMRVMGQNAIPLSDHKKLSELIVSVIQVNEGADKADVIKSWSGGTELVIRNSLDHLPTTTNSAPAVERL